MTLPVLSTVAQMSNWSDEMHARGQRIAFVPTMGALHDGHVALLTDARRRADRLVLSIFVNPTQFGPQEDFSRYPRDLQADLDAAAPAGVDVAFAPSVDEMYPPGHQTVIRVRELEMGMCGDHRPDHFAGVASVVCKLLNIVRPDVALFGEKDYQQLAVIRRMVLDLNMRVEVVGMATVRESDGLAMSSRNRYLDDGQRVRARSLCRALFASRAAFEAGERDAATLRAAAHAAIDVDHLDYLDVRDAETLSVLTANIDRPAIVAVAAYFGKTRLIDNVRLAAT